MLNFSNIGRQIAVIENSGLKKYDNKVICVDTDFHNNSESDDEGDVLKMAYFKSMKLKSGNFVPLPNNLKYASGKHMREILYITASQGSGKSTFTANYIKQYKKLFPQNEVYIVSQIEEDDAFKDIKNLRRIAVDETFLEEPYKYEDFEDSLVVFDDISELSDKKLMKAVLQLRDEIARLGRHKNIFMIQTSHDATAGEKTKSIIRECDICVLFLKGGNTYTRLLKEYLGFNNDEIRELGKIPSRWICFYKHFPKVILSEKYIITKQEFSDEVHEAKNKK